MSKKIKRKDLLTLDDLYNFYFEKNENCNFSSVETGYKLSVQVPAQFEINKEQNDDSLLFCKVKLMHSGQNRNHSSVTDEALKKASKCLAYKPVLANFVEYVDENTGEKLKDFTSHDMILNDDGTTTYLEKQIGCFTSDKPYFEVEEETKHNFLYGYCAIPKEYSDAYSIIMRKNGTKVSVELEINEMQYSASKKLLELTDITIMGVTCLGKDSITLNDVEEGMKNARLDIKDFSSENNSVKFDEDCELLELMQKINVKKHKFQNEYEGEVIDVETEKMNEEITITDNTVENITTENATVENNEEITNEDEVVKDVVENDNSVIEYSYSVNGETKKFAVSLQDKIYAIQDLVNITYAHDDNTYYGVTVYDNYVVMEDYWNGRYFKQNYSDVDNTYSLIGDRIEVFTEFVTVDEQKELENMRSNYTVLKEFKENVERNELRKEKEKLLNSEKYNILSEKNQKNEYLNSDFAELVKHMDEYSLTELETKVKILHSDFVSEHSNFATNQENKCKSKGIRFTDLSNKSKPKKIYGNLFD